ncbi:DUF1569 domain-containing protein [Chitinophagaceae bacterium MMS25-I14]
MKTIFDKATRDALINRIRTLTEAAPAQWGKMTPGQMVEHCILWQEMILGQKHFKRAFIGRIFGKIALKDMLQDKPIKQNLPTVKGFETTVVYGPIEDRKRRWIELIEEHAQTSAATFEHPFFGKMTKEQTGMMAWKHMDHHLKQFNA